MIYVGLDEKDEAFAWLEKAYRRHIKSVRGGCSGLRWTRRWTAYVPTRVSLTLMRRVGFPQ